LRAGGWETTQTGRTRQQGISFRVLDESIESINPSMSLGSVVGANRFFQCYFQYPKGNETRDIKAGKLPPSLPPQYSKYSYDDRQSWNRNDPLDDKDKYEQYAFYGDESTRPLFGETSLIERFLVPIRGRQARSLNKK